MTFIPSKISIDTDLLALVGEISRKQGELSAYRHGIRDSEAIEATAAVDAVHFSTKIEGNLFTRDQVTQVLRIHKTTRSPTRDLHEIMNYARARRMVREGALKGRAFNDEWVLQTHAEILKGIVKGRLRGHYREAQCVVQDAKTRAIVYMAPEWGDVEPLMKGLLRWLRAQRKAGGSALLLAAQFHFEFVTIHPFMDGNGRLARLLTNGILMASGYEVERYAALEKQHERNRGDYYRALRELQANNYYDISPGQDIRTWVSYWLRCLLATYDEALSRVTSLGSVAISAVDGSHAERLAKAEALFRRHGRLRAGEYADLLGIGRTQAVADMGTLMQAGLIERVGGGRSTVYQMKARS